MKSKVWKFTFGTCLGLAVIFGYMQVFVSGQVDLIDEEKFITDRRIEGAWRTTVTPRNCQTGDPVAPSFPGFLVFHRGGTISGTSTAVSSAYGVWKRESGRRNYSFKTLSFRYGPTGAFIGTHQINQSIALAQNGDEFTSTGTFELFDPNGNQIGSGCATAVGTRFE